MRYKDLKIGLQVAVTKKVCSYFIDSDGIMWPNSWIADMDRYINPNITYTIVSFDKLGVNFEEPTDGYSFPWESLLPVPDQKNLPVTDQKKDKVAQPTPTIKKSEKIITGFKNPLSLNEVYSSNQWKFSFLAKNGEMAFQWVMCKDYLHDAIHAQIYNKQISVYGFRFTPGVNPPINLNKVQLLMMHDDNRRDWELKRAVELVHLFESYMGIKKTTLSKIAYKVDEVHTVKPAYLVEGSKIWLKSPQLLSLFTLTLRMGHLYPEGTTFPTTLRDFLVDIRKTRETNNHVQIYKSILQKCKSNSTFLYFLRSRNKIFNKEQEVYYWFPSGTETTYHNYSGIRGIFMGSSLKEAQNSFNAIMPL